MRALRQRIGPAGGTAALLALALMGCDGSNPVAPVGAGDPAPATTYTISLTASPSSAFAGVTETVTVTVTVVQNDDNQAPSGSVTISVSTSLGTLSGDGQTGSLLTVSVNGGEATLTLDPGEVPGMAEILARLDDSAGSLMVEVKDPGDPPVAEFDFEVNDTEVVFTDKSSGGPTAWYWFFDDPEDPTCPSDPPDPPPAACTEQNPIHLYQEPGSYKVKLIVTNVADSVVDSPADFLSSLTRFVAIEGAIFITRVDPNTGAPLGGDPVVITGTGGFREPLRVFFGNKLADVQSVSATEIEVLTPPGDLQQVDCTLMNGATGLRYVDTPVKVTVELEDGTSESLEDAFTYEASDESCRTR